MPLRSERREIINLRTSYAHVLNIILVLRTESTTRIKLNGGFVTQGWYHNWIHIALSDDKLDLDDLDRLAAQAAVI